MKIEIDPGDLGATIAYIDLYAVYWDERAEDWEIRGNSENANQCRDDAERTRELARRLQGASEASMNETRGPQ